MTTHIHQLTWDKSLNSKLPSKVFPVLITGASTGTGNHLTKYLSKKGHIVYSGVRKDSDFEKLKEIKNVTPIKLDVTKPRQIQGALGS